MVLYMGYFVSDQGQGHDNELEQELYKFIT